MFKKLAEIFFNNQTTFDESKAVLEWFETAEGKKCLRVMLEKDRDLMDRRVFRSTIPDFDSDRLFSSIQEKIRNKKKKTSLRRTNWLGLTVKAAATVLVILTATFFTLTNEWNLVDQIVEREPITFQTAENQHREITLADGSAVRLNKNSEIIISKDYMLGFREITLTGEAYFDVAHNSEKSFIIHTEHSTIEVLGTAFNVKSVSGQDNVQVAVLDRRVSFSSNEGDHTEQTSVILTKGQYGYLNLNERSIQVNEVAIDNYLAWKSGRIVFEDLELNQVCTQLYHLYNLGCSFEDDKLGNLHQTANFSNESINKTLSVISLSLRIDYEYDEGNITWFKERS